MLERMDAEGKQHGRGWYSLLALPFLGLCFPAVYARATPALFGLPFFYWYQLAWVLVTAALMALVYIKVKSPR